jgi:predicted metal-binding membrane protein
MRWTDPMSRRGFVGLSMLLYAGGAAVTVVRCVTMAPGGTPMPGGWVLSMTWADLCGRSRPLAVAAFVGMWLAMTLAMMLPSLAPVLSRYRASLHASPARRDGLTLVVAAGYFVVWMLLGLALYPLGVALVAIESRQPALAQRVPLAVGAIVLAASVLQFSGWKASILARCRHAFARGTVLPAKADAAWRQGVRLGFHCVLCCAGPTAVLLAAGIMELRAMIVVAAAVTLERLAPSGRRAACAIGFVGVLVGALMIARELAPV